MKFTRNEPISIIVPVLNEAENLGLLFKRIDDSLTASCIPYEIIVIDDHSTDDTKNLVRSAKPQYHAAYTLKRGKPGKAYSLLEGFKAANYDLICMIDADLQYPPEAIPRMYRKMLRRNADIVVTKRSSTGTGLLRQLSSRVYNLLFTQALFGIGYDTQSGLKLFKKSVLAPLTLSPSPWSFDLEFVVKALAEDFRVVSHDITFAERNAGTPKVKMLSTTIELSLASLRLKREMIQEYGAAYMNIKPVFQPTQKASTWLLALLACIAAVLTLNVSSANALSLNGVLKPVENLIQPSNNVPTPPPITQGSEPSTSSSSGQKTSNAGSSSTSTDNSSQAQPVASTQAKPTTSPTAGGATATPQQSDSSSLSSSKNSSDAAYYTPTKLSSSHTNKLLSLAFKIFEAGGGLLILGILVIASKLIAARITHRRPVRN